MCGLTLLKKYIYFFKKPDATSITKTGIDKNSISTEARPEISIKACISLCVVVHLHRCVLPAVLFIDTLCLNLLFGRPHPTSPAVSLALPVIVLVLVTKRQVTVRTKTPDEL